MSIGSGGEVFVQSIHGDSLGGWARSAVGTIPVSSACAATGWCSMATATVPSRSASRTAIRSIIRECSWDRSVPALARASRPMAVTSRSSHCAKGPASLHVASFPSLADEIVIADGVSNDVRWGSDGALYYAGADRRAVVVTLERWGKASRRVEDRHASRDQRGGSGVGHRRRTKAVRLRLGCLEQWRTATADRDGERFGNAITLTRVRHRR